MLLTLFGHAHEVFHGVVERRLLVDNQELVAAKVFRSSGCLRPQGAVRPKVRRNASISQSSRLCTGWRIKTHLSPSSLVDVEPGFGRLAELGPDEGSLARLPLYGVVASIQIVEIGDVDLVRKGCINTKALHCQDSFQARLTTSRSVPSTVKDEMSGQRSSGMTMTCRMPCTVAEEKMGGFGCAEVMSDCVGSFHL